jgi:hypothetical protein
LQVFQFAGFNGRQIKEGNMRLKAIGRHVFAHDINTKPS